MSKLNEEELLRLLGMAVQNAIEYFVINKDKEFIEKIPQLQQAHLQIRELIKILFAKEISTGPIKKDISRPDLIEWLQGLNQAATAVKDYYVMKATTQLIEMVQKPEVTKEWIHEKQKAWTDGYWKLGVARNTIKLFEYTQNFIRSLIEEMQEIGMDKIFVEKKARELMDLFRRGKEEHDELPLHTAINIVRYMQKPEIKKDWLPTAENINALPKPVRNYIADMQTNADPPSMVADNIILRDTVKALEIKCEERPAVDKGFVNTWADEIEQQTFKRYGAPIRFKNYKELIEYMLKEAGVEVVKK